MTLALSDWAETLCVALPRGAAAVHRRPPPHPGRRQTLAPGESLVRPRRRRVRARASPARRAWCRTRPCRLGPPPGGCRSPATPGSRPRTTSACETVYLVAGPARRAGARPIDHLYRLLMAGLRARYRARTTRRPPRLRLREDDAAPARSRARSPGRRACWTPSDRGGSGGRGGPAARRLPHHRHAAWACASAAPPPRLAATRAATPSRRSRAHPTSATAGDAGRRVVAPRQRAAPRLHRRRGQPVALLPPGSRGYRAWLPGAAHAGRGDRRVRRGDSTPRRTMFYRPLPERPLTGRDILAYMLRGNRRDLARRLPARRSWRRPSAWRCRVHRLRLQLHRARPATAPALGEIAALLFVIAVTIGVFAFMRGVVTVRVQARVDNALQAALWDRLLSLPPSFFRGSPPATSRRA